MTDFYDPANPTEDELAGAEGKMDSPKGESCKSALSFISAAYQDEQSEDEEELTEKPRKNKRDKKHKKRTEQLYDPEYLEVPHKHDKYQTHDRGSESDEYINEKQSKKHSKTKSHESVYEEEYSSSSKSSKKHKKSKEGDYYEESYQRSRERQESPEESYTPKKHKKVDIDNEYVVETITSKKHKKSEDIPSGKKQKKSKVMEEYSTKNKEQEEHYRDYDKDENHETQRHTRSSKHKYEDYESHAEQLYDSHSSKSSKKHKHKKQYEVDYENEDDIAETKSRKHKHKHDKRKSEIYEPEVLEIDDSTKTKSKDYYMDETSETDHIKLKIKKKKSISKIEEDLRKVDDLKEFSHKEKPMGKGNIFDNVKSEFGEPCSEQLNISDDMICHKVTESGEHGKTERPNDHDTRVKAALESILKANESVAKPTVLDIPMPDTIPLPPEPVKVEKPSTKAKEENKKSSIPDTGAGETELPLEPRRSKRKKQRRFSDHPDPPDVLQPTSEVPSLPPQPVPKPPSPLEKLHQQPQLAVKIEDFHKVSPSKSPKKVSLFDIPIAKLSDSSSIESKIDTETTKPLNKISFSIKTKFPKLKRPTGEEPESEAEPKRDTHHDPEIKQLSNLKFKITNILGMKETSTLTSQPDTKPEKVPSSLRKEECPVDRPQAKADLDLDEVFELRKDIKPKLEESVITESTSKTAPPVAKDKAFMPRIFTVKPSKQLKQLEAKKKKVPTATLR